MSKSSNIMKANLLKKNAIGQSKRQNKDGIRSIKTMDIYIKQVYRYAKWLNTNLISARTLPKCADHIQDYIDSLVDEGKAATTIHLYASALAKATNTKIEDYIIPPRTERLTRSRGNKDKRADQRTEGHERLVAFAKAVGIRREEYKNLRGDNLVERDGRLYVVVKQGKGGKYQEQAISKENEALVRSYFDGNEETKVFSAEELNNKIDLHAIRAEHAREVYWSKVKLYKEHPEERENDFEGLKRCFIRNKKDWRKNSDMRILSKNLYDVYNTRGCVREQLVEENRPTKYDRLATMVVSVENLSHYRCDVTVGHYFR